MPEARMTSPIPTGGMYDLVGFYNSRDNTSACLKNDNTTKCASGLGRSPRHYAERTFRVIAIEMIPGLDSWSYWENRS